MVDEEKFRDLNGDVLRKINQNGIMALIHAHLFSLPLIREVFGRQMQLGKVPEQLQGPQPGAAALQDSTESADKGGNGAAKADDSTDALTRESADADNNGE